jgi:hypothetical protein
MLPFDSGFTRSEGEGGTSCHLPFPGRPGLSQSCSRRVFHPAALRLLEYVVKCHPSNQR